MRGVLSRKGGEVIRVDAGVAVHDCRFLEARSVTAFTKPTRRIKTNTFTRKLGVKRKRNKSLFEAFQFRTRPFMRRGVVAAT
jgi:hypothetical protein